MVASTRERLLLAGLVAGPAILGRIPWLREDDFTDPACGSVFTAVRREHESGRPVDPITLATVCSPRLDGWAGSSPLEVVRDLRPAESMPTAVPFLARMVVGDAVLRDVERAGHTLVQLTHAHGASALGAALLGQARAELEALQPHAVRWAAATDKGLSVTRGLTRGLEHSRDRSNDRSRDRSSDRSSVGSAPLGRALDRDAS